MELEPVSEIPPDVPTRMVNDFVYFSRFFHLAWSTGETGENDYTSSKASGSIAESIGSRGAHRRVTILVQFDRRRFSCRQIAWV
jgi:hypothetical protein